MHSITLYQPGKIVFGSDTIQQLPEDCRLSSLPEDFIYRSFSLEKYI
jgi:alcohol dehydrogenase YqhD (iron-dependent ADH family)